MKSDIRPRPAGPLLRPPADRPSGPLTPPPLAPPREVTKTPARDLTKTPERAAETVTLLGRKMSSAEFNTAMVHFYRGEVQRSNTWRNRLDTTTNWAVITAGATLSFAFSSATSPSSSSWKRAAIATTKSGPAACASWRPASSRRSSPAT
jgi:hypothetical protein